MKTPPKGEKPMTARRQQILDKAFAQLRKSRAAMDPSIIRKIKELIGSSPEIMKKLGIAEKPLNTPVEKAETQQASKPPKVAQPIKKGDAEEIDQAKNMEVLAKLMELNPAGRENIKSVIKKSSK